MRLPTRAQVPFVFGDAFELTGDAERTLSSHMGSYWRNFAHTSDPNVGPASVPTKWAPFGANESTQVTLQLDVDRIWPVTNMKHDQCEAFNAAARGPQPAAHAS